MQHSVFNYYSSCSLLVLGIFVLSGVILLPVLLPVAVTDKGEKTQTTNKVIAATDNDGKNQTTSKVTFDELDKLSMGNITVRSVLHRIFLNSILVNFAFIKLISCVCV